MRITISTIKRSAKIKGRLRIEERERGDLELEGERREDDGAFLLENFADIVTGGGGERQANRLPHYPIFLSNRPDEKLLLRLANFN